MMCKDCKYWYYDVQWGYVCNMDGNPFCGHEKDMDDGGDDMTTHEKAKWIELANEFIAEGEVERNHATEWECQYMTGWHCGGGNKSIANAKRILELIDVLEIIEGVDVETAN